MRATAGNKGWAANAVPSSQTWPQLFGQLADDSDEGTVFIFQPLVVGFQFC